MSDITKAVQQTYNTIGVYFSRTRTKMWPEVQKWLDSLEKDESVLDVGCGNGRLLTGVKTDIKYLGIDNSKVLLEEASKIHPGFKFQLGDITKPSTWENLGKYNRIFCIAVFHHLATYEEQSQVLRQMHSHVQKTGKLYLAVWNLYQPRFWKYQITILKLKNLRWLTVPFQKTHLRFCFAFDKKYLSRILTQSGWLIEDIFYADENGMKTNWYSGKNLCAICCPKLG